MAEYTQNYKLKKPLPNEFYDVADQNGNMDKIDSTLKKHDDLLDKKVDLDETGKIPQDQLPELDFIPNDEKGQPNGVAELDENGNLKLDQFPELNFDPAGSAVTVQGNLNAHINNKQNPHNVTAAQIGTYTKTEITNLINTAISANVIVGSYIGDNAQTRVIKFQKKPKLMFLVSEEGSQPKICIAFTDSQKAIYDHGANIPFDIVWTNNSVTLNAKVLNSLNITYRYALIY